MVYIEIQYKCVGISACHPLLLYVLTAVRPLPYVASNKRNAYVSLFHYPQSYPIDELILIMYSMYVLR